MPSNGGPGHRPAEREICQPDLRPLVMRNLLVPQGVKPGLVSFSAWGFG